MANPTEPGSGGSRAPSAACLAGKLRLQDVAVEGRRVLVRADFNVPVRDGAITDDTRIRATLPTLEQLLAAGARVAVVSHRGRPGGAPDSALSMRPVAGALAEALGIEVAFAEDCVGAEARRLVDGLAPGALALLENLRFHPGETAADPAFAAELAALADVYVNDAFGVSHRAHASVVGVAAAAPVAVAGRLLGHEVDALSRVLLQPASPFVLLLGGAKVSDKVAVISHLLPLVDRIIIGGAMANAFLASCGTRIGGSLAPEEAIAQAAEILQAATAAGVHVVLPEDLIAAPSIDRAAESHVVVEVAADEMALDIGPRSRELFAAALADARTVVWNGPMGVFESPPLAAGTLAVAEAVAALEGRGFTVVGGGDTAAAAALAGISDRVSHVSTGGGASLDLLSGAVLPGIAALTDRESDEEGNA